MQDKTNFPTCERANDLVSFLYGECDDHELRDFERHLKSCSTCQMELESLGGVRESVSQYKVATLPTFVSSAAFLPERRRSAAAAVREFFALSPAWLKIGVAFASLLFCILAVFSLSRIGAKQEIIVRETGPKTESGYSQQQVDEMIRQAREEERQLTARNAETPTKDKQEPKQLSGPKNSNSPVTNAPRVTSIRRPLSRAEREQLAADLRLLARPEDDGLELIGDRINQ